MKRLSKAKYTLVILLNVIIAIGYYVDNLNANYSELSSDIQNIIPVAQKFDNPNLFQEDLFLNDINNVKYYTPFYVQTLRFIAKFTNYNYVRAINVMGLICHLLFGILWFFLLFKFVDNYWVCLLVSIIMRGIVWLPGLEIWGISDLWTMMPRTVYITLLPIPFLLLSYTFKKLLLASFFIGFIFNFHPISGLGGILSFLALITMLVYNFSSIRERFSLFKILILVFAIVIGMLPFIVTYFSKTSSSVTYDIAAFNYAFNTRIPAYFTNAILFLKQWLSFKTLFFIIPIIAYFLLTLREKYHHKKAKLLLGITIILILIPTFSIPIEHSLNNALGMNLRMSFQLVRMQKVAIVPGFFALAFLLDYVFLKLKKPKIVPYIFSVYMVVLVFSETKIFKQVPFFGDDISTSILPHNLSVFTSLRDHELYIDKMSKYIKLNTPTDAVICGSFIFRGATKRSVIFDGKGASMLIEGNPKQFIDWQKRIKKINSFKSINEVVSYLKRFNTDYFVTTSNVQQCELIHKEGKLKLYKL
ncbi:hypothetical protein ACKGJY_08610 [Hyunsoonleella sp. 2307UL5-6]|uniref:hypothetical protein n=1 Tax=Hyunsoonleella sp. 2307UL5-6 TaxID=3384768 RepID=UPI0039BD3FDE